jgi:ribosomal protein S18 acetylase RimI-like enzyme
MNKKIIMAGVVLLSIAGGSWFFKGGLHKIAAADSKIELFNFDRDAEQVEQLFRDDWLIMITDESSKTFSVDFLLRHKTSSQSVKMGDQNFRVWRENDQVVGFLAYYKKSPYAWQLNFLIVRKDYRGKGLAGKLIQYCLDDAVSQGAVRVDLTTRATNLTAQSLYENKFGFKRTYGQGKYYRYSWYKKQDN